MGNLTQNLKTRFSGLVESVKSWRTARGNYDYIVSYIQNIDAKQIEVRMIKMLIFRHWRLWRSGVSDNRGNFIFFNLQFWELMLEVITKPNVLRCQLVYGIWSRKWEWKRDSIYFCIEISFRFSSSKNNLMFLCCLLKQQDRAGKVSGPKVPPTRPNVLKGLPTQIHWLLWNLSFKLQIARPYMKFYINN